ncbi:MAG TPA: TolC family protein [Bacteroidota bacterium]|nr:TolC family protein [Bacteroidota bacterium]
MRFFKAVILTAAAVCGPSMFAQTNNLTLDQATQVALQHNLSVIQADANIGAAQAGVTAAYGGYLPSISTSGVYSRIAADKSASSTNSFGGGAVVIPPSNQTFNQFQSSINANLTLFDGLNRQGQIGQATSHSVSTEQTAVRTRQSIVFQTESAYLNILRNEQLVKVADENLKRDNRQLERISESARVGASAQADVYRQQSVVAADEFALIEAQATYDKSKADLVDLIGLDVAAEYTFSDPTISLKITPGELDSTAAQYKDFLDLEKRSLAARPDYRSAVETLSSAQSSVTAAKSTYWPSVIASAGYTLGTAETINQLPDSKTLNWGLRISWTLFDGFATNANVQSAIANRRIAEIGVVQAERDIYAQLRKALLDFDAARKQYEVSQKGLTSATEDRKIAEEKYNLGAGTLLDLLTANAGLVQAQVNLVNSVYNYITAKKNVDYIIGERAF